MKIKRKRLRKLIGKPVRIRWVDSFNFGAWDKPASLLDQRIDLKAAGFLVGLAKDRLIVSAGLSGNGETCANLTIPLAAVRSVKRLK